MWYSVPVSHWWFYGRDYPLKSDLCLVTEKQMPGNSQLKHRYTIKHPVRD